MCVCVCVKARTAEEKKIPDEIQVQDRWKTGQDGQACGSVGKNRNVTLLEMQAKILIFSNDILWGMRVRQVVQELKKSSIFTSWFPHRSLGSGELELYLC